MISNRRSIVLSIILGHKRIMSPWKLKESLLDNPSSFSFRTDTNNDTCLFQLSLGPDGYYTTAKCFKKDGERSLLCEALL